MRKSSYRMKSKHVTSEQKEHVVQFMEQHLDFANDSRYTKVTETEASRELWKTLASHLNSMGGAQKSPVQWKKTWSDLRRQVIGYNEIKNVRKPQQTKVLRPLSKISTRILGIVNKSCTDDCDKIIKNEYIDTAIEIECSTTESITPSDITTISSVRSPLMFPSTSTFTTNSMEPITSILCVTTATIPQLLNTQIRTTTVAAAAAAITTASATITTPIVTPTSIIMSSKLVQPSISPRSSPPSILTTNSTSTYISGRKRSFLGTSMNSNKLFQDSNIIEKQKVNALNRIADAMEKKNQILSKYVSIMEERNKMLRTEYLITEEEYEDAPDVDIFTET